MVAEAGRDFCLVRVEAAFAKHDLQLFDRRFFGQVLVDLAEGFPGPGGAALRGQRGVHLAVGAGLPAGDELAGCVVHGGRPGEAELGLRQGGRGGRKRFDLRAAAGGEQEGGDHPKAQEHEGGG